MKAYKLQVNLLDVKAGAIFVHDKKDTKNGSIAYGALKLAWDNGNEQSEFTDWCGGTFILPGGYVNDKRFFKKIKNKKVHSQYKHKYRYHL